MLASDFNIWESLLSLVFQKSADHLLVIGTAISVLFDQFQLLICQKDRTLVIFGLSQVVVVNRQGLVDLIHMNDTGDQIIQGDLIKMRKAD